jgi:hypothetical protein
VWLWIWRALLLLLLLLLSGAPPPAVVQLDEADRMVEAGHFEELTQIIGQLPRGNEPGAQQRQMLLFTATLHAVGVDGVGRERKTLPALLKRLPWSRCVRSY